MGAEARGRGRPPAELRFLSVVSALERGSTYGQGAVVCGCRAAMVARRHGFRARKMLSDESLRGTHDGAILCMPSWHARVGYLLNGNQRDV